MINNNEQQIRPSIFDRLLDDEPDKKVEGSHDAFQATKALRESVRRDLEQLLNTRYRITSTSDNAPELELSLVNYGLPDLATINLVDEDTRIDFCRSLETTIRRYEPRFKSIKVNTLGNVENGDRTVRFRIDAVLHADPAPEVIIFDSVLEPVSRSVEIIDVDQY
ncbi:MAG: type VI secretion system baseplate subunit TssE [Moraxellaceae bacterium]|nr:MAG: type VI secretion system baseplate subunit TssE [Moraxellaceae bacterium]